MEIKGKVHCLFEQSGTFKREFMKLGISAEDYDIQDNFGVTDHVIDLFEEIEKGYNGKPSLWDNIKPDDLILAFFPCIYFSCMSQMLISYTHRNYRYLSAKERIEKILERSQNRERYFTLAVKMIGVAMERNLRLIMENPWSEQTYLKANFPFKPAVIDMNRLQRGDYFIKPTAYWFINCEATKGYSYQPRQKGSNICYKRQNPTAGMCSEERSAIHPDYARNFICDFIIGKEQKHSERLLLFE